jgi:hypothetical protein
MMRAMDGWSRSNGLERCGEGKDALATAGETPALLSQKSV